MRGWLLLGLVACGEAEPVVAEVDPVAAVAPTAAWVAERLPREVDCATSAWRYLCAATKTGTAPAPPSVSERTAWLGLIVPIRASQPIEVNAQRVTDVGLLVATPGISDVAPRWNVGPIRPSDGVPVEGLATVAGVVGNRLRGTLREMALPDGAKRLLEITPKEGGDEFNKDGGTGFVGETAPGRIYAVQGEHGPVYVTIQALPGGALVGLFPAEPITFVSPPKPDADAALPELSWPGASPGGATP